MDRDEQNQKLQTFLDDLIVVCQRHAFVLADVGMHIKIGNESMNVFSIHAETAERITVSNLSSYDVLSPLAVSKCA